MKNQRIYKKPISSFEKLGFTIVRWNDPQDFSIRCVTAKPGPIEIFDSALNSNYWAIKVLPGFDKLEVKKIFEKAKFTEDDFITCTVMNFFDDETLYQVLTRV